ncbi:MAG: DUF3500 domain-containing protein [Chloroflexi bacterium]|nr:DUF3500 domain-containing protein [Chloroflexota bacterium]
MMVRALVVAALAASVLFACGEDASETAEPQAPAVSTITVQASPAPAQPVPTATASAASAATTVPSPAATVAAISPTTAPSPAVTTAVPAPGVAVSEALGVVDAANAFLDALTEDQRSAALLAFNSPLRPNWSNLPPGLTPFEHNGVRIGDLDATHTELLHDFLRAALSPDGYVKVVGIVGAEDALALTSSRQLSADNYWLAFFGEPSADHPWGWQFGGHHLAVNVTVVDGRSYLSPTLVAIQPASYEVDGVTVAPLAAEVQAGLALMNALDESQREAARVQRPSELWAGAGKDGVLPPLEGSAVAGWSESQQDLLLDAVAQWVGLLPAASAKIRMVEIADYLGDTYFAWHGNVDAGRPIYYRIQGPALIIEFATQSRAGGDRAHYHSIYRDPTNEYGAAAVDAR